ncbi:hypothetical protein F4860DRAFT_528288 [Xylaria cubensis]|nr:hypothetical protein F4860DRAFT_528288 [Xylaria cubensis]
MASGTQQKHSSSAYHGGSGQEPLAIVGMSCRFAGHVKNPDDLWELVSGGKNAWTPIPASRFNQSAFYHPWGDKRAATPVKGGYFLQEDLGLFDPGFFGLSTNVAADLDPQIRWLLELTYEAAESAGLSMQDLAGSNTSVYAGAWTQDYRDLLGSDPLHTPRSIAITSNATMLSARISHFFDLRGSCMTLDTACSTTSLGLHLACQSLRSGESKCAIVAGSSMHFRPESFVGVSGIGVCGPEGKCFAFDNRAQGYGRGEGAAVLFIKTLSDALRDRDPIRAIIRESGTNQDGKTDSITSPNPLAQKALIRDCYQRAGLDPRDTDVVEAHGTGTIVGDKTEADAIGNVLGRVREANNPLYIASVKTNIGHTEAASGLAAVIKVVKSLEKGQIAPSLNFEKGNDEIDFDALRLKVPLSLTPWPSSKTRRVSINNFGAGGTNTHLIMEQAEALPAVEDNETRTMKNRQSLFIISARDKLGVQSSASNLANYLRNCNGKFNLQDIAYTLGHRRTKFGWSVAVTASSSETLIENLSADDLRPVQASATTPRIGYVFNGQGAQWFAMGRELMERYSTFLSSLQECDAILASLGAEWSVIEELQRDESTTRVNEVEFSMPICCILQLSLVRLLQAWKIAPTAVTGHSTGEIAAAFAAGALDLKEAVVASYYRGKINSQHIDSTKPGAMLAVGLGALEILPYLQDVSTGKVVVACHNSPQSVTLAGDLEAINEIQVKLTENAIFARKLKVQAAFHSHHMVPLAKAYRSALIQNFRHDVDRKLSQEVQFFSPVTGERVNDGNSLGPEHWVDNMLKPVLFVESFHNMVFSPDSQTQNIDIVVEIGPHSALAGPIRQSLSDAALKKLGITYGCCLSRGENAVESMQKLAGLLWQRGNPVDLSQVNFEKGLGRARTVPDLPSYPWNHSTSYWIESRWTKEHRMRKHAHHELLGVRVPGLSDSFPVWRMILRVEELPWMRDHVVQSEMIYPAAGYIAMAIEAMRQLHEVDDVSISGYSIRDLQFDKALKVPDNNDGKEVQLHLEPIDERSLASQWRNFQIYATSTVVGEWDSIAHGMIAVQLDEMQANTSTLRPNSKIFDPHDNYRYEMEPQDLFNSFKAVGISHGPLFQNLTRIRAASGRSTTTMQIPNTASTLPREYEQNYVIHPITLDGVFQSFYCSLSAQAFKTVGASVPRSIKSLFVSSRLMQDRADGCLDVFSNLLQYSKQGFSVVGRVTSNSAEDHTSHLLVEIEDMHFQNLGQSETVADLSDNDQVCTTCEWVSSPALNNLAPIAVSMVAEDSAETVEISKDVARASYHLIHDMLCHLTEKDISDLEWHHKRFYDWMQQLEVMASRNELAPRSDRWAKMSEGSKHMLIDKVEKASVTGKLAVRIGKNLLGIMRKEIAPLELMLEGKLLYEFYQNFLNFPQAALQAGQAVRALVAENPRARILEIGAGTAGCTWPVLLALQEGNDALFEHYDFTDVSAGFFAAAKERLAPWGDLISYSALDIEKDPEQQGFVPGSYDIIIAAQVLHATKNMRATLNNTRKLLAENGKLVLIETTRDTPEVHLIFGTLPGWWLSEEPERKYSPNMPLASWDEYLKDTGFNGIDQNVWEHHTMSCIMTTASSTRQVVTEEASILVIYQDEAPPTTWTRMLVNGLQGIGQTDVEVARLGDFDATDKTCILFAGIGGPARQSLILDEASFAATKTLIGQAKSLLWVTTGSSIECRTPENAIHLGLLRCARLEDTTRTYASLDLDASRDLWTSEASNAIIRVMRNILLTDDTGRLDLEYAERGGEILIPRFHHDTIENESLGLTEPEPTMQPFVQAGRNLRMHVETPGLLDSIIFKDNEDWKLEDDISDGWVEIEPRAFGLNFKDVMIAMGMLKGKSVLGLECAGIVTRVGRGVEQSRIQVGDRVCAIMNGHYAQRVRVSSTSVASIPETMSFETGASFAMAFVTAYYSLFDAGRCEAGDTVLIHAASGGVGQACIILLQWKGIEFLVTAGTKEKREFLETTYGISPNRIFSSRDSCFVDGVLDATCGKGVDVVINSLSGQLLEHSWNLLAQHGRFVEIGKRDIQLNKSLDMASFQKALSFTHVDISQLINTKGNVIQRVLQDVLHLLGSGTISNISPLTSFPISEIGRAMRMMQAGSHIGKMVLVPNGEDMVKAMPPLPVVNLSPDKTYMIVGGLTGIGQSIARWLVDHGARNLLLVSRSAASREQSTQFSLELTAAGARVVVENCDVGDLSDLKRIVDKCTQAKLPTIRGVIHGGMALEDTILAKMTYGQWAKTTRAKVLGTKNIDAIFEDNLDFLILLSSISGVLGNLSQANYAAGGAYQDAFARNRAAKGQVGVTIDLSVVHGVGPFAENVDTAKFLSRSGQKRISEAEVLAVIGQAIRNPRRSVRTAQVVARLTSGRSTDPRFKGLSPRKGGGTNARIHAGAKASAKLYETIEGAASIDEASSAVQDALVDKISDMFVVAKEDIDTALPLARFGVDSLVAIELRNWLVPSARIEMSIFDFLGSSSLADLAMDVTKRTKTWASRSRPIISTA